MLHTNIDGHPRTFDWANATPDQQCRTHRRLDEQFNTDPRSPLHHNNRCPLHPRE